MCVCVVVGGGWLHPGQLSQQRLKLKFNILEMKSIQYIDQTYNIMMKFSVCITNLQFIDLFKVLNSLNFMTHDALLNYAQFAELR